MLKTVCLSLVLLAVCSVMPANSQKTPAEYQLLCSDHTMYKYQSTIPSAACGQILSIDVPLSLQAEILRIHNLDRARLANGTETRGSTGTQPQGSNINQLFWSGDLQAIAQRWAQQCIYAHDTCRNVNAFPVGQNIAQWSSTAKGNSGANWTLPTGAWWGEVSLYSNADINQFRFTSGTGHFTQSAWALTTRIGCGFVSYYVAGATYPYRWYYVCNYGTAGNVMGQSLYKIGPPASACQPGYSASATYPTLCAPTPPIVAS